MKMLLGNEWVEKSEKIEVLSPYDGSVVDTVPSSDLNDVEVDLSEGEAFYVEI